MLALGRLKAVKNLDLLIDAFASLASARPSWRLWIAGEGPEHAALALRAQAAGLEGRVELLGWLAGAEKEGVLCRAAVGAVSDDLCQHRVVVAADRHSGGETGIHPDARSARLEDRQHRPPSGQKAGRRVLGVHPGLDRVAVHHDFVLTGRQPLPRSDAYLPLH